MLIRFSVENFLSYDKKQMFSMLAGRTQNHSAHLCKLDGVTLLKLSAIYGANAAGKSKMFEAMHFASHVVRSKLPISGTNMFCKLKKRNCELPSSFEFELYINGSFYAYGFSAILSKQIITAEWFYKLYPKKNTQEYIYERKFNNSNDSYDLDINADILSLSSEENKFLAVANEFMDDKKTLLINTINRSSKTTTSKNLMCFADVYKFFNANLEFIMPDTKIRSFEIFEDSKFDFKKFINLINSLDTGIVNIKNEHLDVDELEKRLSPEEYKRIISQLDESRNNPTIKSFAINYSGMNGWYNIEQKDKNKPLEVTTIGINHKNSIYDFSFTEESDGTQKIFDLLSIIMQNKDNGIYIVDELERSLHPKVTECLIKLFVELTEGKNAQLIFTTHESSIMSQDIFRRDEIWFVEKDKENASVIYSLDKFSERYDRKIDKAYLSGRYGAIPILAQLSCKGCDE